MTREEFIMMYGLYPDGALAKDLDSVIKHELSLPPADATAEEILNNSTIQDASVPNVPLSWLIAPKSPTWNTVVKAMHEFAAQRQPTAVITDKHGCQHKHDSEDEPTAEGAEEMLMRINKYHCMGPDMSDSYVLKRSALAAMSKFAAFTADKIVEKKYADTEADGYVFCGKCGKMK